MPRPATHGETVGRSMTVEYRAYANARYRCSSERPSVARVYKNRGIEFRFASFEEFYAELSRRPSKNHSVDRIDNDGHYEKGNVRWATRLEQQRNTRWSGQDYCQNGHEFTTENTYMSPRQGMEPRRNCRTCMRLATLRYQSKRTFT